MKRNLLFCFFICCAIFSVQTKAQTQKLIGDCTISYTSASQNSSSGKSVKTVYIRNKQSRTDFQTGAFSQSVIYDDDTKTAVVLRELSGEKYMSTLSTDQWKKQNSKYEGMTLAPVNESETILGYKCIKLKATLKDGTVFAIFYYPGIIPSCSENPLQFKNVPGLVLEYEAMGENNQKITFTATSIDFNPVPHYKFEIPKSGYRVVN